MNQQLIDSFRTKINSYHPVSDETFEQLLAIATVQEIHKNAIFLEAGTVGRYFCFLQAGYMVSYITDAEGKSYNKNIFSAGDWVGSTVSNILQVPSSFTIKAVTDCTMLRISYQKFRELTYVADDLKDFYIKYLEKNWVIDKEAREVSIVMDTADVRYLDLLKTHPDIEQYVSLKDIASHLGITPTQLSRIRREKL